MQWRFQRPEFKRRRHPERIAGIGHRHGVQGCARIGDGACQRTLHRHELKRDRPVGGRRSVVRRDPARARPEAHDTTGIGRVADGTPVIIAVRDSSHARRNGCSRTPA